MGQECVSNWFVLMLRTDASYFEMHRMGKAILCHCGTEDKYDI